MTHDDEVFADALGLPRSERAAFVSGACGGDAALRDRVEALLANEEDAARFLESPLVVRPAPIPEEKPGDRIGRYKLLQKIGEGGCGVVYMAEQEEPVRRRVALKVIKLGMDTKAVVARFEAERQALALMDHLNIARVLDAGATETGRPFFVMELVRGIPITAYCDENHLTPTQRVELFITVCQAIQHAHQKGIIHRDIKPSNILVTVNDGAATPKVIDFGIAKATQGRLTDHTLFTAFEQFIGTPVYMSPEQADMSSLDVDTRSDIYSLGVLLYELLTGQPPFDPRAFLKAGVDEIRHRIREVEPPKPSTRLRTLTDADQATAAKHRGTVPAHLSFLLRGDLDWIVMRCLEKDRTRRYDTANGLVMDLQRHLRHEPVVARPPSTTYLLGKLVRRHRLGFAAAALVAVVLVAGTTFSTWQAIRATRAEHVATQGEQEQARLRANETAERDRAETAEREIRRRAYISDINLIQQALAIDNLGRARDLLNRQRPKPGETDLRGWEWRYLWQFCQGDALRPLTVKDDTVINSIAVSSDGAWLAAGEWYNGGLSIWNLRTREEIRVPAGRSGVRVAFSPREPLLAIAVRADDDPLNRVWLWDANARAVVREIPFGGKGPCTGVFFSEDGQTLATATSGSDGTIARWRVADGTQLSGSATPDARGLARWTNFAVSRDLQLAAYASPRDNKIQVLDLTTGKERSTAEAADELVLALAFSPDGKMLVSGAGFAESTIRLWDTRSLEEIGRLEGHRSLVSQMVFWPDGRTLASASGDHTIRIWDVDTRRLIRTLRGHRSVVNSLALLPDGRTLVSGSKDGTIMLWDAETDRLKNAAIRIPTGPAAWQFSDAGDAIVAVEADTERRIVRMIERRGRDFQNEKVLLDLKSFEFSRAVLASDRPLVAAYSPTKPIRVWDWQRGTMVQEFTLEEGGTFGSVAFLRGGEKILFGRARADGTAVLEEWELITRRKLRAWKQPPSLPTPSISPDESYFVVASGPGPFKRILAAANEEAAFLRTDFATGRQVVLRANTRESDMAGGGFSPDGRFFANGSGHGLVDVIDAGSWQGVTTISGGSQGMFSPAFSPDGMRLAIGSSGADSMMIWDAGTFERILTLPTPSSGLSLIAFSPDGNLLGARSVAGGVSGGRDRGAFYLWRAPSWAEIEAVEKLNKTP